MTVVAFRIDFALIMIFAGVYKITSGYAHADGFERGLVNPWWGWFATVLHRVPSRSPLFSLADHAAYVTEILCGIIVLCPRRRAVRSAAVGRQLSRYRRADPADVSSRDGRRVLPALRFSRLAVRRVFWAILFPFTDVASAAPLVTRNRLGAHRACSPHTSPRCLSRTP